MIEFLEFVSRYRAGQLKASVDRSRALYVCDRSTRLPRRYKAAHNFWKWVGFLLVVGGPVSLFWVPWWVGLSALGLGVVMSPAVQWSAAGFVLEHALEDPEFYREMVNSGVLKISPAEA